MRKLLFVFAIALGCGAATSHYSVNLTHEANDPVLAELVGHESEAGIGPLYSLYDRSGRRITDTSRVSKGIYKAKVEPPCGQTSERNVEVRDDESVSLKFPTQEPQSKYTSRSVYAPEYRFAGSKRAMNIPADSVVEMLRTWEAKEIGSPEDPMAQQVARFTKKQPCIGALVRVVDPPGHEGDIYVLPRSALADQIKGVDVADETPESAVDDADAGKP